MIELFGKVSELLCRYIVPICEDDGTDRNWPTVHGTGLLVNIGEFSFLVSAAHVFDPLKRGRDLYFYSDVRTKCHLAGQARLTPTPAGGRQDDRFDIGVFKLSNNARPPYLPIEKFALPSDLLFPWQKPRHQQTYLITGFPATKSKVDLKRNEFQSEPFVHIATSLSTTEYTQMGISPETHIALKFAKKVIGKRGQLQMPPTPNGLSGSPVWLINASDFANDGSHSSVVGILTTHKRGSRALIATDIAAACQLMKEFIVT